MKRDFEGRFRRCAGMAQGEKALALSQSFRYVIHEHVADEAEDIDKGALARAVLANKNGERAEGDIHVRKTAEVLRANASDHGWRTVNV